MALKHKLFLDFETQSQLSLKKVGVHKYAAHPSTQVICAGFAIQWDASALPVNVTSPQKAGLCRPVRGMFVRDRALAVGLDLVSKVYMSDEASFVLYASDPETLVVAHNIEFERQILKEKYGVDVPLERMSCTASRCARLSLPQSLQDACDVLGLDEQKDMDGHKALMKLTRPRRPSKSNPDEFWFEATKPEDFVKVIEYCYQDVEALVAVDAAVPELPPTERELWMATIEMNQRGLRADMPAVDRALQLAAEEKLRLQAEFKNLFGCKPSSPKAAVALGLPDLQKATVRDALKRTDLSPGLRRGLELRQEHSKASVDKLKAIFARAQDGIVRGSLVYAGAERTNRWSGRGIQPQNFVRGLGKKTNEAFVALQHGLIGTLYADVLDTLSKMMKGFFLGPFCVGDYAQVESRALAWLSGQDSLLELFKTGGDPYCALATDIYHRPITKLDDLERQLGKQGVLGCGYSIGWDKFRRMLAAKYDIQISEELAKQVVTTYRRKYSKIPRFWERMERAFLHIARASDGTRIRASEEHLPRIMMGRTTIRGRPFLYIELPSGRKLYYAYPEVEGDKVRYMARDYTYQWSMIDAYGGQLTGHITQAFCRDLLGDAILRLRALGFHLVLTVHDEIVSLANGPLEIFNREMNHVPAWAAGLPLTAECYSCNRYRK